MYQNYPVDLKTYIEQKIKILKQMGFNLTDKQLKRIRSLKTEMEVDRFARDFIEKL